jgi:hypothetical protein
MEFSVFVVMMGMLAWAVDSLAQASRLPDPSSFLTYMWLAAMGMIGGLVSFYQKVKAGVSRWLNISELIGEMATSGFVGFVTGLLCEAASFSVPLTFALVGITGHMGGRAIFFAERVGQKWVTKRLGLDDGEEKAP